MALKGQAKVKYQRKYMKKRRALKKASAETGVNLLDPSVRPDMLQNRYGELITYPIDADGNQIYD